MVLLWKYLIGKVEQNVLNVAVTLWLWSGSSSRDKDLVTSCFIKEKHCRTSGGDHNQAGGMENNSGPQWTRDLEDREGWGRPGHSWPCCRIGDQRWNWRIKVNPGNRKKQVFLEPVGMRITMEPKWWRNPVEQEGSRSGSLMCSQKITRPRQGRKDEGLLWSQKDEELQWSQRFAGSRRNQGLGGLKCSLNVLD